ncbi:hypothetical protein [Phaeodactylibacter xiamenensis]|uniref:hypothetical protein n=1 Tax=Phaeodactylibacter xiamenensis TaxID=1524460 RepID=UPI0024A7A7B6|nr:hypothetical protein [Phaeodactylibacter xiamenensis]
MKPTSKLFFYAAYACIALAVLAVAYVLKFKSFHPVWALAIIALCVMAVLFRCWAGPKKGI